VRSGKGNYGFDASRCEYVDLVESGTIDPTKVVRIALENAVSVASVLVLTEATLTELPEDKKRAAAAGHETMDGGIGCLPAFRNSRQVHCNGETTAPKQHDVKTIDSPKEI
jgi:hypothetical protein